MDMDKALEQLIELASARGNHYVKGPSALQDVPAKLAELGVFLLAKSQAVQTTRDEALKHEPIEIQNRVDDLRKTLFASKLIVK